MIILLLTPYFLFCEKEMNIINNKDLNEIMKNFIGFLNEIFEANSTLIHIFSFNFWKIILSRHFTIANLNKNDENLEIVLFSTKRTYLSMFFF